MKSQEKLQHHINYFRNEGFKLHPVFINEQVKVYDWKSEKTSNLSQRWVFNNGTLIVTGDAFDSIYQASGFTNIQSVARCDVHYFSSKCIADRDGYRQETFDSDVATENIHQMIVDYFNEKLELDAPDEIEDYIPYIEKIQEHLDEGDSYVNIPLDFSDKYDTVNWMRCNGDTVAGPDWWDGFSIESLNNHPYFHLAALKVAAEQMEQ